MSEILYEDFRNDGRRSTHIRSIVSQIGGHVSTGNDGYAYLEQGFKEFFSFLNYFMIQEIRK